MICDIFRSFEFSGMVVFLSYCKSYFVLMHFSTFYAVMSLDIRTGSRISSNTCEKWVMRYALIS